MLELVLLLLGIALATVGLTGYAIFGPLTCRHLQDRGRLDEMDGSSLSAKGLVWVLTGGYHRHDDRSLRQLALPARIMLWLVVIGLALVLARFVLNQFA